MTELTVAVDKEKCTGCGLCSKICATRNIEIKDAKATIRFDECLMCGHCSAVCPEKAIRVLGLEEEPIEKEREVRLNPDDVLNVLRFRRSTRSFKNTEIPDEVIGQILEAGRISHTAKNKQDVSFVVLNKEKDRIEKIAVDMFRTFKPMVDKVSFLAKNSVINDDFFFFKAPVVILVISSSKTNGILASQNMEFVAEANGLGVLHNGFFTMAANSNPKIKKAIHLPKGKKVAAALVLGYPNVNFLRSVPRKKLDVQYM